MKAEFDKFANNYNEKHDSSVGVISGTDRDYFSEYKVKELKRIRALGDVGIWLDLGCGDGNTSKYVHNYFSNYVYHGIDVSEASIALAKEKNSSLDNFSVYDGAHIEQCDNTYDVVYIATVMHHVPPEQRKSLLAECYRVLKSDGKIVIFEHNPWNPVTRKIVKNCEFDINANLLSSTTCVNMLNAIGYKEVKRRYSIFFPRKKGFKYFVGLEKYLAWCPLGGQYYVIGIK